MIYILIYELLFGYGLNINVNNHPVISTILHYKDQIIQYYNENQHNLIISNHTSISYLRFVRINTLKRTIEETLKILEGQGFQKVSKIEISDKGKKLLR